MKYFKLLITFSLLIASVSAFSLCKERDSERDEEGNIINDYSNDCINKKTQYCIGHNPVCSSDSYWTDSIPAGCYNTSALCNAAILPYDDGGGITKDDSDIPADDPEADIDPDPNRVAGLKFECADGAIIAHSGTVSSFDACKNKTPSSVFKSWKIEKVVASADKIDEPIIKSPKIVQTIKEAPDQPVVDDPPTLNNSDSSAGVVKTTRGGGGGGGGGSQSLQKKNIK